MTKNGAAKDYRSRLFREIVGKKSRRLDCDEQTLLLVVVHDAVAHLMSALEKISKLQSTLDRLALAAESATQSRGHRLVERGTKLAASGRL